MSARRGRGAAACPATARSGSALEREHLLGDFVGRAGQEAVADQAVEVGAHGGAGAHRRRASGSSGRRVGVHLSPIRDRSGATGR